MLIGVVVLKDKTTDCVDEPLLGGVRRSLHPSLLDGHLAGRPDPVTHEPRDT